MKKIFTLALAASCLFSAAAKVAVTYNGESLEKGKVVELNASNLKTPEGIPGFEIAEVFSISGATPIELTIKADSNIWTYCLSSCYGLADEGDGTWGDMRMIENSPQTMDVDAKWLFVEDTPKVDTKIEFSFVDALDSEFEFTVHLNTNDNSVSNLIDDNAAVSVYTLSGMQVPAADINTLPAGLYIKRQGSKTTKFMVK